MTAESLSLASVFEGWDGYQSSLVHAIAPLSLDQLAWRPAAHLRSVGEIAGHISLGRIGWFHRMGAPGAFDLAAQTASWRSEVEIAENPAELVWWLEASWKVIEACLSLWTVADLAQTYRLNYHGQVYAVSRQWTIWRIITHDIHHGGQLAILLGIQGIPIPELGDQGGHLTMPPLAPLQSQA
jgi:uncharacterized damage-inducible protein DinB